MQHGGRCAWAIRTSLTSQWTVFRRAHNYNVLGGSLHRFERGLFATLATVGSPLRITHRRLFSYSAQHVNNGGYASEAAAKDIVHQALVGSDLDLKWLGEGTKADGVLRLKNSSDSDAWVGVQIKSTTRKHSVRWAGFTDTSGYGGMVLICVPLGAAQIVWVIPGSCVSVTYLKITDGGKWDKFRCSLTDLQQRLQECWANENDYLRYSFAHWRQPTSYTQQVELLGHDLANPFGKQQASVSQALLSKAAQLIYI